MLYYCYYERGSCNFYYYLIALIPSFSIVKYAFVFKFNTNFVIEGWMCFLVYVKMGCKIHCLVIYKLISELIILFFIGICFYRKEYYFGYLYLKCWFLICY